MSKFQSTISVVAALASIFGAGAARWKLSQDSVQSNTEVTTKYEQHITDLQKQISTLQQQARTVNPPAPVTLPEAPASVVKAPPAASLPPTPPTPPVVPSTSSQP